MRLNCAVDAASERTYEREAETPREQSTDPVPLHGREVYSLASLRQNGRARIRDVRFRFVVTIRSAIQTYDNSK